MCSLEGEKYAVFCPSSLGDVFPLARSAVDYALGLLDSRARTKSEIVNRLGRRGYAADEIRLAVKRLEELRLVDDLAFARQFVEQKTRFGPVRLRAELKKRGISLATIEESLRYCGDESDRCARAAEEYVVKRRPSADEAGARRLMAYLSRCGFGYGIALEQLKRWQSCIVSDETNREGAQDGREDFQDD